MLPGKVGLVDGGGGAETGGFHGVDAKTHPQVGLRVEQGLALGKGLAKGRGKAGHGVVWPLGGVAEVEAELVAHDAAEVALALGFYGLDEQVAELFQDLVAGGVAVDLVEILEVFKVAVDDLVALGVAAHDLVLHLLPEAGEGEQAREPVEVRRGDAAAVDGVGGQVTGEIGGDDLGQLPQLPAALGGPEALAAADDVGHGPLILALVVDGGVDRGLDATLHELGLGGGGVHTEVVVLQYGDAVFVIALKEGEKILFGKADRICQRRGSLGGQPLEELGVPPLLDVGGEDGDAVQLQADADDLEEEVDGVLKTTVFSKISKAVEIRSLCR